MLKSYFPLILLSVSATWICTPRQSVAQGFSDIGGLAAGQKVASSGLSVGTNLATGTIAPSVPLLVLPGTAGSTAIGLQYTAGAGVKVNDIASEVGLGWTLTGTGAITREVKGMPDDSERGWFVNRAGSYNGLSYKSEIFENSGAWHELLPIETAGDLVNYFKKEHTFQTQFGTRRIGANEQPYHWAWLYPASRVASYGQYTWGPNEPYYASNPNPNVANNYAARYSGKWFPDNEPDVYTITLPIGRVQFVFTAAGVPVPLQDQTIKIQALNLGTRNPTTGGLLHEFKVTTPDGVQYLFGSARGNNDYKESVSITSKTLDINPIPDKTDYTCIHKWLLKSILYPSGEQTDYTYGLGNTYEFAINNYVQQDFVYSLTANSQFASTGPYMLNPTYWDFDEDEVIDRYKIDTWQKKYTTRTTVTSTDYKQLMGISNRQGRIALTYSTAARQDIGGTTKALLGLQLYNQYGVLVKDLRLEQHYADAGQVVANAQPYDRYHLLLDKVIDRGTGCDYTAAYTFTYDTQTFCRNSALKDDWGYLNGTTYPSDNILVGSITRGAPSLYTFNLSGRDRNPSLALSQALILKSVGSATGSIQEFIYELHDYYPVGTTGNSSITNKTIGGLRIKSIRVFDGVDRANDIVDTYVYRKAMSANESSGCWGDFGQYAKMQIMHGKGRRLGEDPLPEALLRASVPFCIDSPDPNNSELIDYYYILRSDASMYQYAADYIDYSCVTIDRGIKGKTQHELTSWADAAHHDYVNEYTRQQANNLGNCPNDPLYPSRRGNELPLPFSLSLDGLSLGYTGGISSDFPLRSSRAAERGLPNKIRQLNTAGLAVAETRYRYNFERSNTLLPTVTGVYVKPDMEVLGFSQYPRYFQLYYYNHDAKWIHLEETTEIVYDQQHPGNDAKRLVNTTLIEYANFYPSKITKFTGFYPRSSTATAYVTEIRRPLDFATGSTPASTDQVTTPALLRAAGMTATTVEQEEYQLTPNGKVHQQATLSEFQLFNGKVLPYRSYVTKAGLSTFRPAYTSQITGNIWAFNRDRNYLLTATVSNYTAESLPANTVGRSGVAQATVWGYGRTIPIAMIQNGRVATGTTGTAAWSTAGHTSFEENGTDSDKWSLPNQFAADAKTGARSAHYIRSQDEYGFGKTLLIPAGEDRRSKLLFSCWAKVPAGSTSNTNFCLVAKSPAPQNGYHQECLTMPPGQDWKYFETIIDLADPKWNAGLAADQDLSLFVHLWLPWGSELLVDEVRIHRADATMETATYLPFVGRTSATKQNGTTSYLTYDANYSPRLQLNHKRDIMQRVQQHLVNEPRRPTAEFAVPQKAPANCAVAMVAEYGSCAAGTTFTWEFGDGRTAVNSTPTQNIQYAQPGTYQVALTVTNQERGTARVSKSITIVEDPLYTEMDVQGSTYVDLCETPSPEPVVMTAQVLANCQGITYRWQSKQGGQAWSDVGVTSNTYTRPVMNGTTFIRCIVGLVGGIDNSNSPDLQEITITGYYPNQSNQPGGLVLKCPVTNQ